MAHSMQAGLLCCQVEYASSMRHLNIVRLLDVFAEGKQLVLVVRPGCGGLFWNCCLCRAPSEWIVRMNALLRRPYLRNRSATAVETTQRHFAPAKLIGERQENRICFKNGHGKAQNSSWLCTVKHLKGPKIPAQAMDEVQEFVWFLGHPKLPNSVWSIWFTSDTIASLHQNIFRLPCKKANSILSMCCYPIIVAQENSSTRFRHPIMILITLRSKLTRNRSSFWNAGFAKCPW